MFRFLLLQFSLLFLSSSAFVRSLNPRLHRHGGSFCSMKQDNKSPEESSSDVAARIEEMAMDALLDNRAKERADRASQTPTFSSESPHYREVSYEGFLDVAQPGASWELASENFVRQTKSIFSQIWEVLLGAEKELDPLCPPEALKLSLSNEDVAETERKREESGMKVDAHPVSLALYNLGCAFLDNFFDERPIQRFWFLETVARVPYFSYVSMLHLYESLGWWRAVELRKVHSAEDWNELHHLLIMESLGGNRLWSDRFLGYHAAFLYFWLVNLVFLGSPRIAYQFMELLEAHAVDTYLTFCRENRDRLAELPPPLIAKKYYRDGDLYLFDDFQSSRPPGSRRPPCNTLLDVFENIAIDEAEHVKTMAACQDYCRGGTKVVSPHLKYGNLKVGTTNQRGDWKEWSDEINNNASNTTNTGNFRP